MNITMTTNKNFSNNLYFVCTTGERFSNLPEHIKAVFDAKLLSSHSYYDTQNNGYTTLVGLGDFSAMTKRDLMEASAVGAKAMGALKINEYSVSALKDTAFIPYIVQGIVLGLYKFAGYKTEQTPVSPVTISIDAVDSSDISSIVSGAYNLASATNFAKDIIHTPSNMLFPASLADIVKNELIPLGLEVEIFDENEIKDMGMGAFLAVAYGSIKQPRLIVIRHKHGTDGKTTALIGKGLTMDTGGYSLKPSSGMEHMHTDMSGAGAVIGAMMALALNNVKTNTVAIIAACENRIGEQAHVPGDIITSMSGKTIEILNTDAEGRLTLADAITYAIKYEKADRLVDIATLTGAVVAALGHSTAGTVTNNVDFYAQFSTAAYVACEQYWQLPNYSEYKKMIQGTNADLKNTGKPYAGSITAGLFIGEFTENLPWIHIDIAGTSRLDEPVFSYQSSGASGSGVATLYHLVN